MLKFKLHTHLKDSFAPLHYWVTQIGKNGKVLNTSETFKTKQAAHKNIKAAANGRYHIIIDILK